MKQSFDYKTQFKIIIFGILLAVPLVFLSAETVQELNNKIQQKNSDISKLEEEIKIYQAQLGELAKQKNSLAGSIKELDITKKKLNADISVTQNKVDKSNLKLQTLGKDINTKEGEISNNIQAIMLAIRKTNELELSSVIEVILSEDDFSLIWNDIEQIMTIREKLRETTIGLRKVKGELEDTRDETTIVKDELLLLKSKLADQRKIVEQNTTEKNTLLKQTQNSEASYQKLLIAQSVKKEAFEKELRDFESQLKFILDPSSLPSGRVLSWPLDSIFVTSPFGPRGAGFHGGTDFRAPVGTPVKAVADGVVLGAGNTDLTCPKASFGQWILIQHGNGLSSTYAHLSLIKVRAGDRVSRGEIIGYSGNTGSSTGPHLHLSVYASKDSGGKDAVSVQTIPSKSCQGQILTQPIAATNAYLNPMTYLPPL